MTKEELFERMKEAYQEIYGFEPESDDEKILLVMAIVLSDDHEPKDAA